MPAQAPDRRRDRLHPHRPPRGTLFFQLLSRRYEKGALLLTSNRSFSRWNEIFGDLVIATAISNRILHKFHMFNIDGHSYRLKNFNQIIKGAHQKDPPPSSLRDRKTTRRFAS
jgi:hypothetical protein